MIHAFFAAAAAPDDLSIIHLHVRQHWTSQDLWRWELQKIFGARGENGACLSRIIIIKEGADFLCTLVS